ncbi:hypothetical protein [Litoreibacter roseus]|uniref:Uncharacterized protein n=1 Tax=Litoreibacter roseus TaxID=2601869 RepID=A0A6N6JDQ7_9RHOB|nr:hypothetical protein [Litoreibacter roseus]GFE64274.1 hypothetical protein KIN_13480 [Litoreibacter roseus]
MRALTLAISLATICTVTSQANGAGFAALRCNERADNGVYQSGLRLIFPDREMFVFSGDRGLTDQIAFSRRRTLAWTRATFPDLIGSGRGIYDRNCGRGSNDDDDD